MLVDKTKPLIGYVNDLATNVFPLNNRIIAWGLSDTTSCSNYKYFALWRQS